jgi:hypothetical protein
MIGLRHLALALSLALVVVSAQAQQAPGPGPAGGPAGQAESSPPLIDSITYSGNSRISSATLAAGSSLKPGIPISKPLVGAEIERIVAVYRKAGFDLAILPRVDHPAAGHVTITFLIDENGKGGEAGPAPPTPGAGSPPPAGASPPH